MLVISVSAKMLTSTSAATRAGSAGILLAISAASARKRLAKPMQSGCLRSQPASPLTAADERPRLHDVNLPFHVRPLDVLVAATKHTLDSVRSCNQAANDV